MRIGFVWVDVDTSTVCGLGVFLVAHLFEEDPEFLAFISHHRNFNILFAVGFASFKRHLAAIWELHLESAPRDVCVLLSLTGQVAELLSRNFTSASTRVRGRRTRGPWSILQLATCFRFTGPA